MLSVLASVVLLGKVTAAVPCDCSCFGGMGRIGKASADGNYCLSTWGNAYGLCPSESGDSWKDLPRGHADCGFGPGWHSGCCNMPCCGQTGPNHVTDEPTSQPTDEPTSQPTDEPNSPSTDTILMTPWDISADLTCNDPQKCACASEASTVNSCASYNNFNHPDICSAFLSAEDCERTCRELPDCNYVTRGDFPNGGSFCHLYNVCEETREATYHQIGFRKTYLWETCQTLSASQLDLLCDSTDGRRRLLGQEETPGQSFHKWHMIAGVLAAGNIFLVASRCQKVSHQEAHVL